MLLSKFANGDFNREFQERSLANLKINDEDLKIVAELDPETSPRKLKLIVSTENC